MSARLRRASLATVVVLAAALSACSATGGEPEECGEGASCALSGTITVFAAASLTETFTEIAADFEDANPGTAVVLNFAGSSALVTQIVEGAPADVFASANPENMAKVVDAGLAAAEPLDFASNVLEIAVPPGNPAGIETFADLAGPEVRLVVCAPEVPCGAATVTVEEASGVALSPVSEESSVTDVLGKVVSGEADAGLVYVTDVAGAGTRVEGIEFEKAARAVNVYPIVALEGSGAQDVAAAFVAFVAAERAQGVLRAAGFGAP